MDGTLIRSFLREGGDREDYDEVEVLDGRRARINALIEEDRTRFAVVTNQGGVAFGYQTEQQVCVKMGLAIGELGLMRRPTSLHIAFCHPNAKLDQYRRDDGYRKPGPGMLLEAIRAHSVGLSEATFVGDMDSDREAALAARIPYLDQAAFFDGYYG